MYLLSHYIIADGCLQSVGRLRFKAESTRTDRKKGAGPEAGLGEGRGRGFGQRTIFVCCHIFFVLFYFFTINAFLN